MEAILFDFFRKKLKPQPVMLGLQEIIFNGRFVSDVTEMDYHILFNDIQDKIQEVYASEQKLDAIKKFEFKVNELYKSLCSWSLNQKELINISEIKLVHPNFIPQNNPMVIEDINKKEKILDNILSFYNLQNDERFLFLEFPELNKILISKEYKSLNFRGGAAYETEKIKLDEEIKEEDLYFIYSLAHLRYVLDLHKEFLLKILQFIEELKEFSSNPIIKEQTSDDKNEYIPLSNNENFYFNLKKKEVAMFFKILHGLQWIGEVHKKQRSSRGNLIAFLNNSNSFYLGDDEEYHPIKNIGREFSDITLTEKKEKFQHKEIIEEEIEFIKYFKATLENRIKKLEIKSQELDEKS
jgi:hypothetical protein